MLMVNTLRPRQNGRHFPDDIFKWIFLNENVWIPIKISLKFVPEGSINDIPELVQIMAWRRPGNKPLSESMMVSLLMHICIKCHDSNKANLRDLIAATGLVTLLKLDSNRWFFSPCDLEIWWMTPKNNRAPFLCYFKLFASFRSHWWIKTGVTVWKRLIWVKTDDFF